MKPGAEMSSEKPQIITLPVVEEKVRYVYLVLLFYYHLQYSLTVGQFPEC